MAIVYERPSGTYTSTSTTTNATKYQTDSGSSTAISSAKVDGDFNKLIDAINQLGIDIDAVVATGLPSQTGNSDKFLTTDGTTASWGAVSTASILDNAVTEPKLASAVQSKLHKIAAPTASKHGALLYQNDLDDGYDALTSQGTSGQVLTSNGADASPSWGDVVSSLSGATITTATVSGTDKVLLQDTDDLDTLKTVTAQSIADLGGEADATTSVKGIIELATDAEAFAGVDSVRALVPSNFGVKSLATNGYQKLAGGLIIQWGLTALATNPTAVVFPTTFPTACLNVTTGDAFTSGVSGVSKVGSGSLTTTGFNMFTTASVISAYWVAIGY